MIFRTGTFRTNIPFPIIDIFFLGCQSLHRNKAKTDWTKFRNKLYVCLGSPNEHFESWEDIDREVVRITGNLVETFKECCPLRTRGSPREKPWLTGDLINLGRDASILFNWAAERNCRFTGTTITVNSGSTIIRYACQNATLENFSVNKWIA